MELAESGARVELDFGVVTRARQDTMAIRKEKIMAYTNNQKACLLLRLFLGVQFLFAGLGKIIKGVPGFVDYVTQSFEKTMLPSFLVTPYACALPFVELLLGIMLLLGIFADVGMFVAALTLLSLFFGKWIEGDTSVAAYNAVYFLITLCAVRWFEHVAPSVDVITREKKLTVPLR